MQITPVAFLNTIAVLERVGNAVTEADPQLGSSLVETIILYSGKVMLPSDQETVTFLTENVTGTVSLFMHRNKISVFQEPNRKITTLRLPTYGLIQ